MFANFFESILNRSTLVSPEDTWALFAIMCSSVALAIWLEQKYSWASKISGAIIALIIALILSNLSIIPTNSVLYDDIVWGFAVPMGIPLLLLQCNMKKIWTETGRLLILFLIGSIGTCIGTVFSYFLLKDHIPNLNGIAAMMTGSYIGGGVNFAALAEEFDVGKMVGPTTVADNLLMALYFFTLIYISGMKFFRKRFSHPHIDRVENFKNDENKTQAATFWSRKDISIKDIAFNIAYAVVVVYFSKFIAGVLEEIIPTSNPVFSVLNIFFGSYYVWITSISMVVATFAEKRVGKLNGSQEIGTYLIYLFLFVIGVPASIVQIVVQTPLLLLFTATIVIINMIFCFVGGRLLRFDLEDCILASNACIGGPTTAAGMAISQGWNNLVGPIMLIGTLGYVIGTYLGVLVGGFLGA